MDFEKLKSQLPTRFAKEIAAKSSVLSPRQVQLVFRGEITDISKVDEVIRLAKTVKREFALQKRMRKDKIRSKKATV